MIYGGFYTAGVEWDEKSEGAHDGSIKDVNVSEPFFLFLISSTTLGLTWTFFVSPSSFHSYYRWLCIYI